MAEDAARELDKADKQQKGDKVRRMARKQLDEMKESMRRSNSRKSGDGSDDSKRGEDMEEYLRRASGQEDGEKGEGQQGEGQQGEGQQQGQAKGDPKSGQQRDGNQPGEGDPQKSNSAGKGEGDRKLGDKTSMAGNPKDTKVDGRKSDGASKSEIIKAASEKGFATTDYKDVYVDYESVVEEVMDREEVPAGYRYYIKRYFQLIKPRE